MKKTRNLFILTGNVSAMPVVMNEIQYKGITLVNNPISVNEVAEIYNNNKSIVCTAQLPNVERLHEFPIYIEVANSTPYSLPDCIDISLGDIPKQFENIANRYNCDIGDHKSNSSGLNGCPTPQDCTYCKIISRVAEQERLLYESENFFVVSTLGEFIKGYLLIIPKAHIMSMAELDANTRNEFIEVIDDVSYILKLTYNVDATLVWENGTGNSGLGKAKDSIVHAHTHIAPSNLNAHKIQEISKFPMMEITLSDFPNYNKHSYLIIRGTNNDNWYINNTPSLYIPRQYIRQILAEEHNIVEKGYTNSTSSTTNNTHDTEIWNWRTHPFYNLMKETDNDIRKALKNNWETIPQRIKSNTKHLL